MTEPLPNLDDVEQAHARIRDAVRRTPCLRARFFREPVLADATLTLKLECLQVTGSFKPRGAISKVRALAENERARGLVTASGGNHGLGVAYAAWQAGVPATVFLPTTTPKAKAEKLGQWGASVIVEGDVFDEANAAARAHAERHGASYVHAFADPLVVAGQGTVGLEIMKQAADTDAVVVAIGGGGLIAGIATAVKSLKPGVRVIGVEPEGAPTVSRALEAGAPVDLGEVKTAATSLAARRTEALNFAVARARVDEIVLVSDEEMRAAARHLWFEMGLGLELGAAAALAALRTGRYRPAPGENVCAVVCGAGTDGTT